MTDIQILAEMTELVQDIIICNYEHELSKMPSGERVSFIENKTTAALVKISNKWAKKDNLASSPQ